jgi:hypothetical protein
VCALLALASGAGAQATVRSARLEAELEGGRATVRVEYVLAGAAPGDTVGVSLLDFGAGLPQEISVGGAGEPVRLGAAGSGAQRARLPLEAGATGEARLVAAYSVLVPDGRGAGALVARVPVLSVELPAEAARPGLFHAEVRVPEDWRIAEAFPTGLGSAGAGEALVVDLPVVPSVVTLRFRTDGAWGFPLPLALNLAVAACLAVVVYAGWRQLAPGRS